jgi:hypothetical protein
MPTSQAPLQPHTPKLRRAADRRWYRYYAGYSPRFVAETLNWLELPPDAAILDPWNGSGTTTATAFGLGYKSWGIDLNPVSTVIAKGRVIAPSVLSTLQNDFHELEQLARTTPRGTDPRYEPLEQWFDRRTARTVRLWEQLIRQRSAGDSDGAALPARGWPDQMNSTAAVLYVTLFKAVRALLVPFATRNPTWIRVPGQEEDRISVTKGQIAGAMSQSFGEVLHAAAMESLEVFENVAANPTICTGDVASLPLRQESVDAVVTSPPYCTRIDYIRATLPELAVLGWNDEFEIKSLRDRMLGTPTIDSTGVVHNSCLPDSVTQLLKSISDHPSKAADTYYYSYFRQYFELLSRALTELRAIVRTGGQAVFVVQDSYFKDIHIDLPGLLSDIGDLAGWHEVARWEYDVVRSMAAVNVGAKLYRQSSDATEAAVILR